MMPITLMLVLFFLFSMRLKKVTRQLRVLDFDIENRPLSYWYDGKPTAEITAIGCSFLGSDHIESWELGPYSVRQILENFLEVYEEADMVIGHYIRRHDLPNINGALMEEKLPPLSSKLSHDTKNDLIKRDGLSMSQEALSAMFELDAAKHHMVQQSWRDANRLTKGGIALTRKRVRDDVVQHKQLHKVLLPYLHPPRIWSS